MAAQENGSEQQLESGNDVFFHTLFSTFFSKGLCLMLWKNMMERLAFAMILYQSAISDDIDALAEEEQKLEALVESLDKSCTGYKMKISAEKTKLMTNSANCIQREIKVKDQSHGTVTSFKYL